LVGLQPSEVVVAPAGVALGVEPDAEVSGTVVEAHEASAEWIGRRVVVPRVFGCGECALCRRGYSAACPLRAERAGLNGPETLRLRYLVSVEPPLWPDGAELWQLAALADAALAPYSALARAGVGPSETVMVVGDDARARFATALARHVGATVINDDEEVTPRAGAIVIATTWRARRRALSLIAPGATIVLLDGDANPNEGANENTITALVQSEARLLGAVGGHPDLLPELCALAVRGVLPLVDSTRRVSRDEHSAAHAAYRARGGPLPILAFD
jgi:hypothetical protein